MKKIILPSLIAVAVVLGFYLTAIFYEGIDLFFLPFIVILGLNGLLGVITIPLLIFRTIKNLSKSKVLYWTAGLAIGTYLGYILAQPLMRWDYERKNVSGQLISSELEKYKARHQSYPEHLNELNTEELNDKLPSNYQLERFNYRRTDGKFDLDIPGLTLLHWNNEKNNWESQ